MFPERNSYYSRSERDSRNLINVPRDGKIRQLVDPDSAAKRAYFTTTGISTVPIRPVKLSRTPARSLYAPAGRLTAKL
jgi:hypothetical protein